MKAGKGNLLALTVALGSGAIVLGGCGSDDGGGAAGGSLSADTAEELAAMSDGIADSLEAGDTCDAAHKADELQTAVSEADIPDDLRSEVEAGADQLVNEVNCEEAEEPTTTEKRDDEEGDDEGEGKEESSGEGSGNEGSGEGSGGPPGQGEDVPPGQQGRIKGGI
jgi:hypothetical protein